MAPAAVSDKTFGREVLASATPVLVEFTSSQLPDNTPLRELAGAETGKMKVVQVNVDRHPTLRNEYDIRALPALILFKYGKAVARRVGSLPTKAALDEWIDGALILALATRKFTSAQPPTTFKLANGMQVVVMPDRRAPSVTHMVWYKAGTADDPVGFSGLARLVQNLTYRSLGKIGARVEGRLDDSIQYDTTEFWQRIPKGQLRSAMEMEAERMMHLSVDDDDIAMEREVVLEARRTSVEGAPRNAARRANAGCALPRPPVWRAALRCTG